MDEVIKKEILYDLSEAINILERKDKNDVDQLRVLSDHGIEDVAVHKNLDLISVTVLIYSLYKIVNSIPEKDFQAIIQELQKAKSGLDKNQLGKYNNSIKIVFNLVRKSNAKVKVHF